jgi:hypothetical protein
MQDEKNNSNQLLNETGDDDYIRIVGDVEKTWKNVPTFKDVYSAKDGKWWQPMEEVHDQSDFRLFKMPIIPKDAIEEQFE